MQNKQLDQIRVERGNRYRYTRIKLDITISQLSRFSGLARRQIYLIEKGNAAYSIDSLIKYLHGLKVKIRMK